MVVGRDRTEDAARTPAGGRASGPSEPPGLVPFEGVGPLSTVGVGAGVDLLGWMNGTVSPGKLLAGAAAGAGWSTPGGRRAPVAVVAAAKGPAWPAGRGALTAASGSRRRTARRPPSVPCPPARAGLRVRRREVAAESRRSPFRTPARLVTCRRPGPSSERARTRASSATADASHIPSRLVTPHVALIARRSCRRQASALASRRRGSRVHSSGPGSAVRGPRVMWCS